VIVGVPFASLIIGEKIREARDAKRRLGFGPHAYFGGTTSCWCDDLAEHTSRLITELEKDVLDPPFPQVIKNAEAKAVEAWEADNRSWLDATGGEWIEIDITPINVDPATPVTIMAWKEEITLPVDKLPMTVCRQSHSVGIYCTECLPANRAA
jgi:hypothetical protein